MSAIEWVIVVFALLNTLYLFYTHHRDGYFFWRDLDKLEGRVKSSKWVKLYNNRKFNRVLGKLYLGTCFVIVLLLIFVLYN